jgi:TolA-binding protein
MASTDDQVADLRRQIEELEAVGALEAQLVSMKEAGEDAPENEEYRQLKDELRAARAAHREGRAPATADPATVETTTT